jgi:hypothetical protein
VTFAPEQLAQNSTDKHRFPVVLYVDSQGEYRMTLEKYYLNPALIERPPDYYQHCQIIWQSNSDQLTDNPELKSYLAELHLEFQHATQVARKKRRRKF